MAMETRTIANWHDISQIADEFKTESWIFRGGRGAHIRSRPEDWTL